MFTRTVHECFLAKEYLPKCQEEVKRNANIILLTSIALVLTILDLYTSYILELRGYIEANPFMAYISTTYGLWMYISVNLLLSIFLITFLAWGSIKKLDGNYRYVPLLIFCVVRGAAVVNNVMLL